MAEDFYSDNPGPGPSGAPSTEGEVASDSNVALLPLSFFPPEKDVKPGSVCKVRVQEVQEDQALVTYEHDETSETAAPQEPPIDEEMAGYMA